MPDIELFTFLLPPDAWRKKPAPSRWKMTIEDAAKHHPGATPILSTREVRTGNSLRSHSSGPMPGSDAWRRLHGDDFADNVPYGNPPAAMLESKE